jgi:hypothetical protein
MRMSKYYTVRLTEFQIDVLRSLIAEHEAGQPDPHLWPTAREIGLEDALHALNLAKVCKCAG